MSRHQPCSYPSKLLFFIAVCIYGAHITAVNSASSDAHRGTLAGFLLRLAMSSGSTAAQVCLRALLSERTSIAAVEQHNVAPLN